MNCAKLMLWPLACVLSALPAVARPGESQHTPADSSLTTLQGTRRITMEKFVIAKLFIQPAFADEFRQALEKLAVQTRKEPGCLDYTYYPEPGQTGVFTLIEHYRDVAGLKFHFRQSYLAEFVKKVEGWKSKDLQVYFLSSEPDALKDDK
ncbi:MAG: antibiotic biosynthesis monooxygenase [Chitinophaga sp.]|uniref:putative quinol monooxygenase n=1 Tax=Chitinophaga sp. TaxID=1869181 RepID=UPI001AFEE454|nr:putative quinol monooxygenase [Chitinophaga sp.]MBO9729589.1 antibiotic biosynthesis monooxygenase [Chitinophaga sp.]